MSRSRQLKLLPWLVTPALVVLLVLAWHVIVTAFNVNPFIFPPPGKVWDAFVSLLGNERVWAATATTVSEIIIGFLIAAVLGVVVGVALGKLQWLEVSLRPLIVISQVAPKVAFVPLFVIWFGFGLTSKVVLSALLAFFPIMLNVLLGVRSVEQGQREVMKSLNATKGQTFLQLEMRSLQPYLFAGMEVAIVLATIGAIVGEYLGGSEGLGHLVVRSLNALDAPQLFAVIVLLAVMGSLLYAAVTLTKRLLIPWHDSVAGVSP